MQELDRMVGNFEVDAAPARFEVSNLIITPIEVKLHENVSISALVTNVGGSEGAHTVWLSGSSNTGATIHQSYATGVLQPGKSETASWSLKMDTLGQYTVTVDGQVGTFSVLEAVKPAFVGLLVKVGTIWSPVSSVSFTVGDVVELATCWQNPSAVHSWQCSIEDFLLKDPDGLTVTPTLLSASNTATAGPGGVVYIRYQVTFNKAGSWSYSGKLKGKVL